MEENGKVTLLQQVDERNYQFEEYRLGEYQAAVCYVKET